MGSYCEIQLYLESRIDAKRVVRRLAEEINRLEKKYSRFIDSSFLSRINFSAGERMGIKIDSETKSLFEHALTCYEQSDGFFDITSGILNRIWDFDAARVPTQPEIDALLPLVGFDKLSWRGSRLMLPKNMQIDFGGIVKEYAADAAAKLGRSLGVQHGLVNLGGDFAVIGAQPDGQSWTIGVADPKADRSLMARIDLADGGLASSGDYERCFIHEGKRYSHILNPRTGWPCSGLRAVSVAANLCTVAGSVATIAMLKEQQDGISWLQDSSLPHVYMTKDEQIDGIGLKEEPDQEEESA